MAVSSFVRSNRLAWKRRGRRNVLSVRSSSWAAVVNICGGNCGGPCDIVGAEAPCTFSCGEC